MESSAFASAWLKVISRSSSAERIRARGGHETLGLRLLPFAGLMEQEDAHENRQGRQQIDVVAVLHVPRGFPDNTERPLKDHHRAGEEADDQ